jgi:hypothetical protein
MRVIYDVVVRIRILLALIVAAAVAGLWWIGREDVQPDRRREFVEVPEPPIEERAPIDPDPVETEPEPENVEKGPVDPVETGTCSLLLKIVDAATNEPVRTEVVLWRLDAPANEHWTQGDQIQARKLAGHGLVRFDELPAGDYRAVCERRRVPAEDSRVIQVQGKLTEETIAIHMPRKFRVYLKVFDLEGDLVTKGRIERWGGDSRVRTKRIPDWYRPRRPVGPDDGRFSISETVQTSSHSAAKPWDSTATEQGFFLGELEENSYSWQLAYGFAVRVPGGCAVRARIDGDFESGTAYVGITVPVDPILERILVPDGKRADKSGAYVRIWTQAIRDDGTPPLDRLRRETVRVSAVLRGYRALRLKSIPLSGPRETWVLAPTDRQG